MADASEPDEGGSDLFDRWLSHRQESTGEAPRPRTYGVPRTGLAGEDATEPENGAADAHPEDGSPAPTGPATARTPAHQAAADAPVAERPRIEAIRAETASSEAADTEAAVTEMADTESAETSATPTEDEARRAEDPGARTDEPSGVTTEPPVRRAPVGLDEFEPVVIASVRRQAETPVEKRSRLARFRRAGLEPDPQDASPDDATDDAIDDLAGQPSGLDQVDDDPAVEVRAAGVASEHAASVPPTPITNPEAAELVDEPTSALAPPAAPEHVRAEPEETATLPPAQPAPTTAYVARHPTPPPPVTDEPVIDEPVAEVSATGEPAAPTSGSTTPRTSPRPAAAAGAQSGQDAAAAVFAAFNPGAAPTPAAPPAARGTTPATTQATTPVPPAPATAAPTAAPPAAPTTPEPPRRAPRRPRPSLTSYVEAARTTLDRSVRGTPEERTPSSPPVAGAAPTAPDPTGQPAPDEATASTAAPGAAPARSAYDELRAQREAAAPPQPDVLPPSIDFRPRTLARRITSVLLLVGLAATGLAAWRAYDSRVETDIGLAAILALVTGIVWAVRAGSVPTRVGLHGGVLEVRSQAGRFVFEVTGAHTRLEVVGSPGRRGSRLLVHRRGLAPFAITPAMVDLRALVEALRYYRPEL